MELGIPSGQAGASCEGGTRRQRAQSILHLDKSCTRFCFHPIRCLCWKILKTIAKNILGWDVLAVLENPRGGKPHGAVPGVRVPITVTRVWRGLWDSGGCCPALVGTSCGVTVTAKPGRCPRCVVSMLGPGEGLLSSTYWSSLGMEEIVEDYIFPLPSCHVFGTKFLQFARGFVI